MDCLSTYLMQTFHYLWVNYKMCHCFNGKCVMLFNVLMYKYLPSPYIHILILNTNVVIVQKKQMNWPCHSNTSGTDCSSTNPVSPKPSC